MLSSGSTQQRLTRRALALVLAGGRGSRLKQLTDRRAKPAVFFGGKFRIIDFALSNCNTRHTVYCATCRWVGLFCVPR